MRIFLSCLLVLGAQFLVSCASIPTSSGNKAEPVNETPQRIAGSWENTTEAHPERASWTDKISSIAREDLPIYNKAGDITSVCPKWKSLNDDQKVKAIDEYWIAKGYYESTTYKNGVTKNWNPEASSVDVGTVSNRNSYSDGLFQMSGTDDAAKKYSCDYKCLHNPLMNITVAMEQMRRQINNPKCGLIFLPNSSPCRYWAVALVGNKYSKIPEIKARVLKYAPECK